jgi:[pyruvate, water dikinase]-phosphate phosphotransferase / [pyruvate, water dikinase] kinase
LANRTARLGQGAGHGAKRKTDMKKVIIVSDGTGKTAKRLLDAVLSQYSHQPIDLRLENTFQQVRDQKRLQKILDNLDRDGLVIFSIVSDDLREYMHTFLHKYGILHINVLEPMLKAMAEFLGFRPEYKPGLLQIIDDSYYRKVDSIGFAVEHDDGRGFKLENADVILLGPSRTCKTPISMYLACNHGVKAANIPIIANEEMKALMLSRLEGIDRRKIIGLTMDAEVLAAVRTERSRHLVSNSVGRRNLDSYHDLAEIRDEIKFCLRLFDQQKIGYIDVTRRAIEEISLEILNTIARVA